MIESPVMPTERTEQQMPMVRFVLNGQPQAIVVAEGETLLETLRERFGLTSLKDGCSPQGQCGCCLVQIDGRALTSCTMTTHAVDGKEVVTLEGLEEPERRMLARCFVAAGGVQCGFCIPGFVARTSVLLRRHPEPPREQIKKQLGSHLCRCTGYAKIVDAVELAAKVTRGELPLPEAEAEVAVGRCPPRYLGERYALGQEPFVADLNAPGMLHGALRLVDHPRACLARVDLSRARALPGVERIVTAADVRGARRYGLGEQDWPSFLAVGEISCYVGDVVAAVAAVDRRTARQAAALIEVAYDEVLEPITDPFAALQPAAPSVHPERDNLLSTTAYDRGGDVGAALSSSAHRVQQRFVTQTIEHLYLEPEACLVVVDEAGELQIYSQGQGIYNDRQQLSKALGLPLEALHVTLVSNGGAFGGKEDLSVQVQTALLAQLCGRPVMTVLSREESIRIHPKRHPFTLDYELACDVEGKLTALRASLVADTGAYASVGPKVVERAAGHACGPYFVPVVDVEARCVYTNNPPNGAMRGFGVNQAAFAIEQLLDRLAEKAGIDSYQIRERNLLREGQRFGPGQKLTNCQGLMRTLEAVKEHYYGGRYAGLACGIKNVGIGNGKIDMGQVRIEVADGGALRVGHGMTEMGQGLNTVVLQLICDVAGLDSAIESSVSVCTDQDLDCGMTTASRATMLVGNAAIDAAKKLRADLDSVGGGLIALEGRSYLGQFVCDWTVAPESQVDEPVTHVSFGFAAQVVLLDEQSGKVNRVVAAHDVGRAIHPKLCEGQIEGSIHMGLGQALSEDLQLEGGWPQNTTVRKIGVLRSHQTPDIEVILVEEPEPLGPFGARGVGEIGLVPTAPAVAQALYRFDGRRRTRLPMRDNYEKPRR